MPQQVEIVEQRILPFNPDVVMYCVHTVESNRNRAGFLRIFNTPDIENHPDLKLIAEKIKITRNTSEPEAKKLLNPYTEELNNWGLDKIIGFCEENDLISVLC